MQKEEKYRSIYDSINLLLAGPGASKDLFLKVAALLQDGFDFLWTGFYFVEDLPGLDGLRCIGKDEGDADLHSKGPWLILGPSVGPPACEKIRYGRGVCGTAWKEERTVVVPDVDLFPGHIACSSESRSEIVVPLMSSTKSHIPADGAAPKPDRVLGVLDIDSREQGTFDAVDAIWLERICSCISNSGLL